LYAALENLIIIVGFVVFHSNIATGVAAYKVSLVSGKSAKSIKSNRFDDIIKSGE